MSQELNRIGVKVKQYWKLYLKVYMVMNLL